MTPITVKDLARELGMDRSHCRKFVLSLGIEPIRHRVPGQRGSALLAVSPADADRVRSARREAGFAVNGEQAPAPEGGMFYAIALDPEARPGRIKFGFAANIDRRLSAHRTSAPEAVLLAAWPARRSWEATLIDALSDGGAPVSEEVFDMGDIDVVARGDLLMAMLPAVNRGASTKSRR